MAPLELWPAMMELDDESDRIDHRSSLSSSYTTINDIVNIIMWTLLQVYVTGVANCPS